VGLGIWQTKIHSGSFITEAKPMESKKAIQDCRLLSFPLWIIFTWEKLTT
jgi:hypothetical protein